MQVQWLVIAIRSRPLKGIWFQSKFTIATTDLPVNYYATEQLFGFILGKTKMLEF
jgi:hypothetical protein